MPFITSLFDIGDEVPEEPPGVFIGPTFRLYRIVYGYLRAKTEQEARLDLLSRATQESSGVTQPIMVVDREADAKRRQEKPTDFLLTSEDAETLKTVCVGRIRDLASNGLLGGKRRLGLILYRWSEWGPANEAKGWASNVAKSPEGALLILRAMVLRGTRQGIDDRAAKITYRIRLNNLERFVEIPAFKEEIDRLPQSRLGDEDRQVLRAFQVALKRRSEGKPDDGFLGDDDDER
jgi:hypothetical protein